MENLVEVRGLNKRFGKLEVLKDVSCAFKSARCVAVLGPNASGKTTLIKSLLGMVIPDSGDILFRGRVVNNSFSYKTDIGYMPQVGRYPDNMRIGQLFDMMKDIRAGQTEYDTELLEAYGLESMFQKPMHALSGGTRQKVSAALACMFMPEVLILDEPTAGLDPLAAEILKEKIQKEKAKGKLILVTSHIMSEMDEIADEVLYLREGRIELHKHIAEIKAETGEEKLGKALTKLLI